MRSSQLAEGNDVHPIIVILALLASLNATTNPWIYLCFSSAMLQQVKVGERVIMPGCVKKEKCCAKSNFSAHHGDAFHIRWSRFSGRRRHGPRERHFGEEDPIQKEGQ